MLCATLGLLFGEGGRLISLLWGVHKILAREAASIKTHPIPPEAFPRRKKILEHLGKSLDGQNNLLANCRNIL